MHIIDTIQCYESYAMNTLSMFVCLVYSHKHSIIYKMSDTANHDLLSLPAAPSKLSTHFTSSLIVRWSTVKILKPIIKSEWIISRLPYLLPTALEVEVHSKLGHSLHGVSVKVWHGSSIARLAVLRQLMSDALGP